MENAGFPRRLTAKVKKKRGGEAVRPGERLAGVSRRVAWACNFYRLSIQAWGADYRERLNSLSFTHMFLLYGWLLQERSLHVSA